MIRFSLHNRQVEIPLQGMEFIRYSTRGGLWSLLTVNLFMPPHNKQYLNSIPEGNLMEKQQLTFFYSIIQ